MLDNLMLLLIVVVNSSLLAILIRLNAKHKDFFTQMQFGGILYGSTDKMAGFAEFILKRKYLALHDTVLTVTCNIFIVSFVVSVPLMVITILKHS